MLEYVLVVGLIAVVVIAVVTVVGRRAASSLCSVEATLGPVNCPPFTEYTIPTPGAVPYNMASGPDNAIWFTESYTNRIGRLGMDGVMTEYPITTPATYPYAITTAPAHDAMWFTEPAVDRVGRIPIGGGAVQEVQLPAGAGPRGITVGMVGVVPYLWVTEPGLNEIARIDPNTPFLPSTPSPILQYGGGVGVGLDADHSNDKPWFIRSAPDGNLWFGEFQSSTPVSYKIGKFDMTSLTFSEFATATTDTSPNGLTVGPDNLSIWFVERSPHDKIGRIPLNATVATPGITEFPTGLPTMATGSLTSEITAGPDGALWFTEYQSNKIGRMTTDGTLTNEYPLPKAGSTPVDIVVGPDNAIWFTEPGSNRIGRLAP